MDENNKKEVSDLTVIALVTSVLIAPLGWFLGFRARKEIERNNGFGRPFATAAIWIGGILTIGAIAMFGLAITGVALGEHQGWGYGHHQTFNGRDRGMMDWYDNG